MLALLAALLVACAPSGTPDAPPADDLPRVETGAQGLVRTDFEMLRALAPGRAVRVGLVTNHTARVDTSDGGPGHLIDRLAEADGIELAVLFGPEHGLRGTAEAGEAVQGGRDASTGARVVSLYGRTRRPPQSALQGLDVLVFDMQDIGARFYTYISTMGYAMQAAAEADIPFVILDRPNPLGGDRVEGFMLETRHQSFVGLYPIPVQHGLTPGELARMIQGEGWLAGLQHLDLRVAELRFWERAHRWTATGLPFVPTSPNIPDFETAVAYPGTGLFEGVDASEGRGTPAPFLLIGAPGVDAQALADTLQGRGLPGVAFEPARLQPRDWPGRVTNPRFEGRRLGGVRLHVTDASAYRPVATGVHLLHAVYHAAGRPRGFFNADWLAHLAGTDRLRQMLAEGARPEAIVAAWAPDVAVFRTQRRPYLLYD